MPENWAEDVRTVDFRLAVEFELNENPGKLRAWCGSSSSYTGKKVQIVDRFDDIYAEEIDTRNGDTKNTDTEVERRWLVKPKRQSVAPLIDPDDQMATKVGLKSPLAVGVAKAIRRAQDDRVLQGFYGTAYTGEEGATAVAFKAANVLAADFGNAGTDMGLTLAKLIRMRRMIAAAFVDTDMETPIMPVTSAQIEDLLSIEQIQSRDFNPLAKQALQDGKVATFMGFTFVPCEYGNAKAFPLGSQLTLDGDGNRRVPVFVPSGLHFGSWLDFEGHADLRPDKNHSEQIAGYTCGGATRTNEDKCFQILCKEAA